MAGDLWVAWQAVVLQLSFVEKYRPLIVYHGDGQVFQHIKVGIGWSVPIGDAHRDYDRTADPQSLGHPWNLSGWRLSCCCSAHGQCCCYCVGPHVRHTAFITRCSGPLSATHLVTRDETGRLLVLLGSTIAYTHALKGAFLSPSPPPCRPSQQHPFTILSILLSPTT